jgi:hypothetical protein
MDRDERGDQVIFFLMVNQSTERPWTVGQTQPRIDWETVPAKKGCPGCLTSTDALIQRSVPRLDLVAMG